MYIPRYPTLWPKHLISGRKLSTPFPLDQENIAFYNLGRTAIYNAIRILNLSPGDKVLLPSYICFDVVTPFLENGIKTVYYELNQDLSINKEDVEEKIKRGVKALFFVHYFGFPQDLRCIEYLKKKYHIYLIEDCAHALLSEINGIALGSLGDVSIFSLKKIVPVHNVGILVVKNRNIDVSSYRHNKRASVYKGIMGRLLDNIKFRSGITFPAKNIKTMREIVESGIVKDQFNHTFPKNWGISMINKTILNNLDHKNIKKIRRANFRVLLDFIRNRGDIIPLFNNLPKGVCPMAFPVILRNRDEVCKVMNIGGIDAFPWPFLPHDLGDNFRVARYFADNIMLLPLHQDLRIKHLKVILRSLEKNIHHSLETN